MWFSQKWDLDLELFRFQQKKIWKVLDQITSCQKIRTIGPVVWPVHREQTDKQKTDKQTDRQTDQYTLHKSDRQTNRGDQYTLQKSTILQSNERIIGDFTFILILTDFDLWPRPLTLTVIYFCKKKLQKTVMLWRHVTQNGASYIERKTPFRWVFLQGILCSQPEVSTTSG